MKNSFTSILSVVLLTVIISVGIMGNASAQVTSESSCKRIREVIYDDLMTKGQLSRDSVVLFLPARDSNRAFQQAQDFCIRLDARPTQRDGNATTYTLADETGSIKILNLKEDRNVLAIVFLRVNCRDLKIKELRFVSLKAYSDLEKSVRKRQQSSNNN